MSDKRPYHHGDLRRVILETAEQMLQESLGWQFTLREVARRAEVSHTAPYRHFPDKEALLLELALRGFERLNEVMQAATTPQPASVRDELLAAADAYIAFGMRHPSLYRLMFSREVGDVASAHLSERAMAVMDQLLNLLSRGQEAGVFQRQPLPGLVAACWAQVHGLTLLNIEGLLLPEKVGLAPVQAALHTLLRGLQA